MLYYKSILILSISVILVMNGVSQSASQGCYGFDCKERKTSISFFLGFPIVGSGKDIATGMEDSGLGDFIPVDFLFGYKQGGQYPKRESVAWNFEFRHNMSKRSGYQVNAGIINESIVQGYEDLGFGNYITIESKVQAISLNYIWRTGKGMSGINIGPSIARHVIHEGPSDDNQIKTSDIKLGVNLGYTLAIVQKKSWFLTVKTNYTWLPDAEVGPYTDQNNNYISTFQKTNIRLQSLNLGVSTGWKF